MQSLWQICKRPVADNCLIFQKPVTALWRPCGSPVAARWQSCGSPVAALWQPGGSPVAALQAKPVVSLVKQAALQSLRNLAN
jgi:hypothetical protein